MGACSKCGGEWEGPDPCPECEFDLMIRTAPATLPPQDAAIARREQWLRETAMAERSDPLDPHAFDAWLAGE